MSACFLPKSSVAKPRATLARGQRMSRSRPRRRAASHKRLIGGDGTERSRLGRYFHSARGGHGRHSCRFQANIRRPRPCALKPRYQKACGRGARRDHGRAGNLGSLQDTTIPALPTAICNRFLPRLQTSQDRSPSARAGTRDPRRSEVPPATPPASSPQPL